MHVQKSERKIISHTNSQSFTPFAALSSQFELSLQPRGEPCVRQFSPSPENHSNSLCFSSFATSAVSLFATSLQLSGGRLCVLLFSALSKFEVVSSQDE